MHDTLKQGWSVWRFDQMATMINDRIDKPAEAEVDRYVGLEHLDADSLTIRRWGVPTDVEATKLLFKAGDIILGRRRVYQRKLALADFDGICSAHAMVLRAKPEIALQEFLPFFMQSDLFMERAKEISVGSLSPTINWKTLAKEEFALPSLEEQRLIALVLQRAARAAETLARALTVAHATRQSLARELYEADIHGPDSILESVIEESRYGPRFSSSLYANDGAVSQLRTTDIDENGHIRYETIPRARLDPEGLKEHLLRDRDLVISRSGTTGMTALFRQQDTPTIPAAFLIRLRTTKDLLPEYLHEFLSSPQGRQMTASLSRGGVQKNINGSQLLAQKVPCPGLARQEQVVSDLMFARNSEQTIDNRVREANQLQAGLLTQALLGV